MESQYASNETLEYIKPLKNSNVKFDSSKGQISPTICNDIPSGCPISNLRRYKEADSEVETGSETEPAIGKNGGAVDGANVSDCVDLSEQSGIKTKIETPREPKIENKNINEMNYNSIDMLLEKEKLHNKSDSWNKLDKTEKIQKLHSYAEKYGKLHSLPIKDIKTLKTFFIESLEKLKLQKTKDVIYDKETREISSIPALHFNINNRSYTLKNMDAKRVSTLKSLTPKRLIPTTS